MGVYDLFSKRGKPLPDVFQYDTLPKKFRNQVWWVWIGLFGKPAYVLLRNILRREHGELYLWNEGAKLEKDFAEFFLSGENTKIQLDAIELSLKLARHWATQCSSPYHGQTPYEYFNQEVVGVNWSEACADAVATINHRFRENGLGYEYRTEANRLVRVDSLFIHQEAAVPALMLLTDPAFKTANDEFLESHKHFRHAEYSDCLTKCCTAFESTIKIICSLRHWTIDEKAPAKLLLDTYIRESKLPANYFEQPLMNLLTLRNKMGPHGKGTTPVTVPEHFAKYALHATSSAILLLVDHAKPLR